MELILHRFELPLARPFRIARGTQEMLHNLIVELRQDGQHGYGETTANPYYGMTIEGMTAAIERLRPAIEATTLDEPEAFWDAIHPELADAPFVHCALDEAAHDLWGKLRGEPVWKLWGLRLDTCPPTDYTIGIDTIDVMLEKMRAFADWPIYKIKLGTPEDLDIVRRLREETDAVFRVDANCGWTVEETIRNAVALKELGVEYLEQPLPADDWDGMKQVFRDSVLPVIADESCRVLEDVDRCLSHFHGINIKLTKCGGLVPARRMIARARTVDLKVMVGCMVETSVGISAIAQLLPMLDYVDMDGALLLGRDVATGVTIDRGRVHFPEENGCGVRLTTRAEMPR